MELKLILKYLPLDVSQKEELIEALQNIANLISYAYDAGYSKGRDAGYCKGYETGYDAGYSKGFDERGDL